MKHKQKMGELNNQTKILKQEENLERKLTNQTEYSEKECKNKSSSLYFKLLL
jgi:hypothetical protein